MDSWKRKLRMGMVGGGQGAFIGGVHRIVAALDGQIELVAGSSHKTLRIHVLRGSSFILIRTAATIPTRRWPPLKPNCQPINALILYLSLPLMSHTSTSPKPFWMLVSMSCVTNP